MMIERTLKHKNKNKKSPLFAENRNSITFAVLWWLTKALFFKSEIV